MQFKMKPVAFVVSALLVSPMAFAGEYGAPMEESLTVSVNNEIDVRLKKDIDVEKDVHIDGEIYFYGENEVDANAMAIVDDKQINTYNGVLNQHHDNDADVGDDALSNASGNIGVNVSAGDNNMQDNAAAIAQTDASFVFGSADAEIFVTQGVAGNSTYNDGNVNSASLSGNALMNAAGNIGVNITSGNSNLQKNNTAVSVSTSRMSEATVANLQRSDYNMTENTGRVDVYTDRTYVSMSGSLDGTYYGGAIGYTAGTESGTYRGTESGSYDGYTDEYYYGGASGTYAGTSDQIGDVYPDVWTVNENVEPHDQHPNSPEQIGHFDLDTQTQGGSDLNGDGGALAFNEEGSYTGTESGYTEGYEYGSYSGSENGSYNGTEEGYYIGLEGGEQELSGTFSGYVTTTRVIYTPTSNDASLSGNALANASGNIGVNVSAGTGNMQNNSLAIATSMGPAGGSTPGNGPE